MKRPKNGHTPRQYAYAMRSLAPQGSTTKKDMALAVGYSEGVATAVSSHIEKTEGYENAMASLASKTGNVALKILHEIQHRDISKENFATLMEAVTTIAGAWERFTPKQSKSEDKKPSDLRAIILREVTPIDSVLVNEDEKTRAEKLDL